MTPDDAVRIVRTQTIPSLAGSGGHGHVEALEQVLLQLEEALLEVSRHRVRALKAEAELAKLQDEVSHDPATCHVCLGRRG